MQELQPDHAWNALPCRCRSLQCAHRDGLAALRHVCGAQVEPYALPAAHRSLLDLSRSLNKKSSR